jgi:hypothetical protein
MGKLVTTWADKRSLRRCLLELSYHLLWDNGRHRLRPTAGHGRSTGGRTSQCSGGGHCPRFLPLGRCLHVGVVVVVIVYLEWGHFRHLILVRSGRSQTTYTSTQIKRRNWVMEGPRSPHFRLMLSLELGGPKAGIRLRPCGNYVG